jgi:hypothetical protein
MKAVYSWMQDPEFLRALMHGSTYMNGGSNHDVWRIAGLDPKQDYVLRVNKSKQSVFIDMLKPPVSRICDIPDTDARAAFPMVEFYSAENVQIADIQPEMRGTSLALTEHGLKQLDATQSTSALLKTSQCISAMPHSFFTQVIRDAIEIEDHGFAIDTKPTNFMLLDNGRIGFVDLTPGRKDYRVSPCMLASALAGSATQLRSRLTTRAERGLAERQEEVIRAKIIHACDQLGLAYTFYDHEREKEDYLRAKFGIAKPASGIRPITVVGQVCTGHGISAADIHLEAPNSMPVRRCGQRPSFS